METHSMKRQDFHTTRVPSPTFKIEEDMKKGLVGFSMEDIGKRCCSSKLCEAWNNLGKDQKEPFTASYSSKRRARVRCLK